MLKRYLETPVGYADFPKEVAVPPFSCITQTFNIVQKLAWLKGGQHSRPWSSHFPPRLPIYGSSLQGLIRSKPKMHPDTKWVPRTKWAL